MSKQDPWTFYLMTLIIGSISFCTISTPLQGMLAFINPTTGYTSLYLFIGRSCGSIYHKLCFATTNWHMGGFLTRRSSAIRRFFAWFLRCYSRTIMKSFLKRISLANSQEICIKIARSFLRSRERFFWETTSVLYDYRTSEILRKTCEKPANRRAASDEKPTPGWRGSIRSHASPKDILH